MLLSGLWDKKRSVRGPLVTPRDMCSGLDCETREELWFMLWVWIRFISLKTDLVGG